MSGSTAPPWQMLDRQAEEGFTNRWTLQALRRVDPELHARLVEQREMLADVSVRGEPAEIELHTNAMCRGWMAAVDRMESLGEPHDAYMLGEHNGTLVAIGEQRPDRCDAPGRPVVWLTPDEVAAMWSGLQTLATVKQLWPGAEVVRVVERYPDEPAQED